MPSRVYLDYNATTPLHPELKPYVIESLSQFGNPSSVHWAGREAKKLISRSRDQVAQFFNVHPLEIIFTSGGSESNNLALKGALPLTPGERSEIICSTVEHPSVMKTMEHLQKRGYQIKWLSVNREGRIEISELEKLLSDKTALVSVQIVNNETGNIFPLKEIIKKSHAVGALVHSDMVQGLGKIPIDLKVLDVDMASFAGHKFYGLKGAGFLFVKRGIHLEPLIHGGGQERSRRAGTENALAIGSVGRALEILGPQMPEKNEKLTQMRDALEREILQAVPNCRVNGSGGPRVSNTLNIFCGNIDGETMLINLDTRGFAVSSGAACSSGSQEPSPVLRAMGFSSQEASQSLRISFGWMTTEEEIKNFLDSFLQSVQQMRRSPEFLADEFEGAL